MDENAGAGAITRNAAWPRRADQEKFGKRLWSALQTHLQGVDRATLAIMPEKCRHRAALLSRLSEAKITRPAKESKPIGPMSTFGSRMRRCQRIVRDCGKRPHIRYLRAPAFGDFHRPQKRPWMRSPKRATHRVSECRVNNKHSTANFTKAGFIQCEPEQPRERDSVYWVKRFRR